MSAEKRPASDAFGSSQLVVKRQKSDANIGNGRAIALVNGSTANGALIQAVRSPLTDFHRSDKAERRLGRSTDVRVGVGAAHKWIAGPHHGADRYLEDRLCLKAILTDRDCSGHSGEVFTARFDPSGQHIASGSMDRSISMHGIIHSGVLGGS